MDKGKTPKNNTGKVLFCLLLISLVLFCAAMGFGSDMSKHDGSNNVNQTEPTNMEDVTQEYIDPTYAEGDGPAQSDAAVLPTEVAPTEELTQPSESYQPEIQETSPPIVIPQIENAEYEKWLAATLIVGVSLEYPDFVPEGIYSASSTSLEEKFSSDGVYIVFVSNGATMAIYSKPIMAERAEAGTKDISSENVGFATFDLVDPAAINVDSMERISFEDLGELISQSLLISIYSR